MSLSALRALADLADALARLARALAEDTGPERERLLPIRDAAHVAGTSPRVIREAVRAGDLVASGRQRDRVVRQRDLDAWIESRKVRVAVVDDADLRRRMLRLAGSR